MPEVPPPAPTGDELLKVLSALGNPHRLRIVAALLESRNYVSALAREIGMSRPLLHMHLQRLEAAGLVVGTLELGEDGKAMKYFDVTPFFYELTPGVIARASATLSESEKTEARATEAEKEEAK
ncbi:ArsR/SmtB family transcription factor [Streptomyces violaceus]